MVEKIGTIKNPLTIIAIFAALAEISGTVILPFIDPQIQWFYVWFLMLFPFVLVIAFFLTLNLNHTVLYAPSDYKDESNFLKPLETASPEDRLNKNKDEIEEMAKAEIKKLNEKNTKNGISYEKIIKNDVRATYLLAEELVFAKLQKEFKGTFQREVVLKDSHGRFIFDGAIELNNAIHFVEVKYTRTNVAHRLIDALKRLEKGIAALDSWTRNKARIVLVIVTDEDVDKAKTQRYLERAKDLAVPVDVRFYTLEDLEEEFTVAA